jgi:hypothetical protein
MRLLPSFLCALFRYWWASLGGAVFNLYGIFAVATGSGAHWYVRGSIVVGVLMLLGAAFLAWREEREALVKEQDSHKGPTVKVEYAFNRGDKDHYPLSTPLTLTALDEHAFNVQVESITADELTAVFEPIACLERGKPFSAKHYVRGTTLYEDLYRVFLKRPQPSAPAETSECASTKLRIRYSDADDTHQYVTEAVFEGATGSGVVRVTSMKRYVLPKAGPPSLWQRLTRHRL